MSTNQEKAIQEMPGSENQEKQPIRIEQSAPLGGITYQQQKPITEMYIENAPILCQFCNQMVAPVFQNVTAMTESGNKTGLFAFFCCGPCAFCVPLQAETKVIRMCPNCKVPI